MLQDVKKTAGTTESMLRRRVKHCCEMFSVSVLLTNYAVFYSKTFCLHWFSSHLLLDIVTFTE